MIAGRGQLIADPAQVLLPSVYPATPGSYMLLFHLHRTLAEVAVGKLGRYCFAPGSWLYCGSAWGPGGLQARIRRHVRPVERLHWHVDYLTAHVAPRAILYATQPDEERLRLECIWVQQLLTEPGWRAPIPGFGSSDCRSGCSAHLLHHPVLVAAETLAPDRQDRRKTALARYGSPC